MTSINGNFFKGGPSPASFLFIFVSSYSKLFCCQPGSSLDRLIRRRGCWPLGHHHCPSFNGNFTSCGIAGQPIVINHLGILNLISKFCYESCWRQKTRFDLETRKVWQKNFERKQKKAKSDETNETFNFWWQTDKFKVFVLNSISAALKSCRRVSFQI